MLFQKRVVYTTLTIYVFILSVVIKLLNLNFILMNTKKVVVFNNFISVSMYLVGRSRVKQKLTHILLCFRGTTNTPLGNKLVYYTHYTTLHL